MTPTFDPEQERPSLWTILPGGTHAKIAAALQADPSVKNAVAAKIAHPTDSAARAHCIEVIVRRTGNVIGQAITKQAVHPSDATLSIYRLLPLGTANAIINAISLDAETHDAFATNDAAQIVQHISRMTGRCVFQAFVNEAGSFDLPGIAAKLAMLAKL